MKRIQITIIAIFILLTGGCKKWLDINTDPATPQLGKAELLLSPIEYQMANNVALDYRQLMKYIQNGSSLTAANIWETHGYEAANDNGGNIWRMVYVNLGPNLELLLKDAVLNEKWTYAGIGYAIKAWAYQTATDYHGPLILDEAFDSTLLTFHYQDQQEVYTRVEKWADTALQCFTKTDALDYTGNLTGSTGDYIYSGNREKWKKFIYALLALHYSHLVKKADFATRYADSVVKYVDLSFANTTEDATLGFTSSSTGDASVLGPTFNILNPTTTTAGLTGRVAQPIVNMLTGKIRGSAAVNPKSSIDPRLSRMISYRPTDSVYKGVEPTQGGTNIPHMWGSVAALTTTSTYPGKYLFCDKARFPFMSYAQLQFAKAEALFIQNKMPDAYSAYIKGIDGHMAFVNAYGLATASVTLASTPISANQITAYKLSSEVAQTSADLRLSDIMTQKYIAQWGWGSVEQWCDLRKYDYDTAVFKGLHFYVSEEIAATNAGKLAYRVRPRYNSEYVWNRKELDKWGGLAEDYHTVKPWFCLPE